MCCNPPYASVACGKLEFTILRDGRGIRFVHHFTISERKGAIVPLRPDDNYRGTRALHVRSHRKLGKHRTLTHASLPMVNWLIENTDVKLVDLGKVSSAFGTKFTSRAECQVSGANLRVLLVATGSAQALRITARTEAAAIEIAREIERQWPLLQAAND